ncbi:MAG TPA: papain-like cysteine protease family protein [Rhodopila sp.]|nr:papain-like cysteine protease family protein [Rhodopila sp.]
MKPGTRGAGVAAVQQGLIDLGFAMPLSTRRFGVPDGIFGSETSNRVQAFQRQQHLTPDGTVGQHTMARLDSLLPRPHHPTSALPFIVSGFRVVLAQPTSRICWATVHAMMRSWKLQQSVGIRDAAAAVDEKYGVLVDHNEALPSDEFGPFIAEAQMAVEPMMNLTINGWLHLLRAKGLLWVGSLNSLGPGAGLHSRIIEGMSGDGSVDHTLMHIMDPDGGRKYQESFRVFIDKYEGAFRRVSGDYFQIRHFQ